MDGMKRQQFTFYRSYYEALNALPQKERLAALDAIIKYALDGEEVPVNGVAATVFILVKPTLDSGRKKAASGKRGGESGKASDKQSQSDAEANGKQSESKPKANAKQTASEKEDEKEVEGEKEVEIEGEDECLRAHAHAREGDPAIAAVMSAYLNKVNPTPSETSLDELKGFIEEMGANCVLRAIDIAVDEKKATWSYIRGILRSKLSAGVRCLADWDALEEKRDRDRADRAKGGSASAPPSTRDKLRGLYGEFLQEEAAT